MYLLGYTLQSIEYPTKFDFDRNRIGIMRIDEILQLVEAISRSTLTEFQYEEGAVKLSLVKNIGLADMAGNIQETQSHMKQTISSEQAAPGFQGERNEKQAEVSGDKGISGVIDGKIIKSPLVGTFYAAPSEDAAPFVAAGDSVKEGQVLAIVEAMKLMNDIESDYTGVVAEILVKNGDTVEYGQPLFVIK